MEYVQQPLEGRLMCSKEYCIKMVVEAIFDLIVIRILIYCDSLIPSSCYIDNNSCLCCKNMIHSFGSKCSNFMKKTVVNFASDMMKDVSYDEESVLYISVSDT